MAKTVLPVAKGLTVLTLCLMTIYLVVQVGQAQQVVVEPPTPGFVAPVDVDTLGLPGPVQPIFYRHDIHANQLQIDCRYCHATVEVSPSPSLPSLSTCMGCHNVVGIGNPGVDSLRAMYASGRSVEWVEVHKLPPFVHFPHQRHVGADPPVTCQTCHGPVQDMPQVYQYRSLKMGWCLDCHTERNVSTDCTVCHY